MSDAPAAGWTPTACTLPTREQPLRMAEFDRLFTQAVRRVDRLDPQRIRLELEPVPRVVARAADLMARETQCCSFFTFVLHAIGGQVVLEIGVPDSHVDVLDALAARATAGSS